MQLLVTGAGGLKGIAKGSGRPYEMLRVYGSVPIKPVETQTMRRWGVGTEPVEVACTPECLKQMCDQLQGKLPALVFFDTTQEKFGDKLETVLTGVRQAQAAAKAA